MTDEKLNRGYVSGQLSEGLPWLVFRLHNLTYTINSRIVTSILQYPDKITPVASAPEMFRGILNFRDSVLPLLDTRKYFGMQSFCDEIDSVNKSVGIEIEAHKHWFAELEQAIRTGEEFSGTTEAHHCSLGKWIDAQAASAGSDTGMIKTALHSIAQPHDALHDDAGSLLSSLSGATKVQREAVLSGGELESIRETANQIYSVLNGLSARLDDANKEMIVVVSDGDISMGLVVDEVVAVDALVLLSDEGDFPSFQENNLFNGVAHSMKIPDEILLVNEDMLMDAFESYSKRDERKSA
ncbi:hypothetical protein FACS189499_00970 [Clostridia bacterium]|nr:hypothetical protein FACS189499_00970 [Clostridia bacterium]